MPLPVAAVAVGVGGYLGAQEQKRRETHIADRVSKYQGFPDEQLRAIITQYGGEMGEAAQQVLNTRVTSTPNAQASLAESTARPDHTLLLVGGAGLVVVLLLMRR